MIKNVLDGFCLICEKLRVQTIDTILLRVRREKTCSKVQLRRYIKDLQIQPLGARQRPQLYPDGTAERILGHLGLNGAVAQTLLANPTYPPLRSMKLLRKRTLVAMKPSANGKARAK